MNTQHGDTEARSSAGLLSESLTETIIGAAIEVHRQLGPGLLESVYEECMCEELRLRNIPLKCQIELPVVYKGRETGGKYRIDLVVADKVVVELKAVERLLSVHEAKLLTYLRLTGKRVGLLINFKCIGSPPGNHAPCSMTPTLLRVSVLPWWMFCLRRLIA
jgi:GxxExxY protein